MSKRTTAFLVLMFGGCMAADAQDEASADFFGEMPVVLSASRLVQTVNEAPAAVTIIDRETIRASGARQIVELFRLVPGFLVAYQNGHEPTVAYHGLADGYARRLQVMIDGVSVYSPVYGGVDWERLPISIDDIERIEVVRGPNGASFGANAFTGMVNIITREPIQGLRTTSVSLNSGTNGIADWSAQHSDGGIDWRYRLSVGQHADRGFDNFADNNRAQYLRLQGHRRLDDTSELTGTVSYGNGYGQEQQAYVRPRRLEDGDVQIRWTRTSGNDELWVQFHHAQRHATEDFSFILNTDAVPPLLPALSIPTRIDFKYETRRDEVEFQQTLGGFPNSRWVWGGQWRQDGVRSSAFFDSGSWLTNSLGRFFASGEWRPAAKLLLHAGATYEHPTLGDSSLSPRMSATWLVASGHSLRVGISRAQRNPVPFEESVNWNYAVPAPLAAAVAAIPPALIPLIPPPWNTKLFLPIYKQVYVPSDGLASEKILSREIAYLGRFPSLRLNGEARWFDDRVRNLIYMHKVPFLTLEDNDSNQFRNLDSATVRGTEGSLTWLPWPGGKLMVSAARTVIASSGIDADYSRTAPLHSGSALFSQELPWQVAASIAYYRCGSLTWLGGGDPIPAYNRVDVRLAKRLRWGAHKMELSWVTQNLNNAPYQDFVSALTNKRTSWLNIRYEY